MLRPVPIEIAVCIHTGSKVLFVFMNSRNVNINYLIQISLQMTICLIRA